MRCSRTDLAFWVGVDGLIVNYGDSVSGSIASQQLYDSHNIQVRNIVAASTNVME